MIGDGRTTALVSRAGSIDWLCLPNTDSTSVFAALLDDERGGAFELRPDPAHTVQRRYVPDTNVLETTFTTDAGVVRLTDAMTLPGAGLTPFRELARRVEGLAGRVPMRWRVAPRFRYGAFSPRIAARAGALVAADGGDAVGVCGWGAGRADVAAGAITGRFEIAEGQRALLTLVGARGEPLVVPPRGDVEARLDATAAFWRRWSADRHYEGPWPGPVLRSALALKLLVHAPSGAIAAAPTCSLPEAIGGPRNWDYRYCWLRDSAFTLEALLQLGCNAEAHSFFWWFMHATALTRPRLQVLYRLDGGAAAPERELTHLGGYRGSRPVRVGNGAAEQLQLDTFGDLLNTASIYVARGNRLDRDTGAELAEVADLVCRLWREPDRGIWEVRMEPKHFTHSKLMCWVALDRAARLAELGQLPGRHADRWRREADAIRQFIETRCWSERRRAYGRFAGSDEMDAAVLLMGIERYRDPGDERVVGTIEDIRRQLGRGPLLYRYTGDDGLQGGEGAFLCCSFWLVEALALAGKRDEAAALMEELVAMANDVGLYAEEVDPGSGEFLGNFPQGLVHLALVSAAMAFAEGYAR